VEGAPEKISPQASLGGKLRGMETVLLVEDEGSLRSVVGNTLRTNGYAVLDAPDGKTAIELAESLETPIDLLLTDVILPGISGRDIADQLQLSHPSMKVIYMSGYTDEFIAEHGIIDPDIVLLEKPFPMSALLENVREVLDGPAANMKIN